MLDLLWYAVKEHSNIYDYGEKIEPGKKILLHETQADLHGLSQVELCDPPENIDEAAFRWQFQEWILLHPVVSEFN